MVELWMKRTGDVRMLKLIEENERKRRRINGSNRGNRKLKIIGLLFKSLKISNFFLHEIGWKYYKKLSKKNWKERKLRKEGELKGDWRTTIGDWVKELNQKRCFIKLDSFHIYVFHKIFDSLTEKVFQIQGFCFVLGWVWKQL